MPVLAYACCISCLYSLACNKRALDRSPESCLAYKMMHLPVAKEISFKDISIVSSGGHVVQLI